MGVEGTVSFLSNLASSMTAKKKKKQMTTVALKVRMDSDGAKSVEVDLKHQKASVEGYVDAKKVLEAAPSTKKKVEPRPYAPYTLVDNPYVFEVYDKKGTTTITETTVDDSYTSIFRGENPNSCAIM